MHWTEEFFVEHGKTYLKTLESIRGRAVGQTEGVIKILNEHGFPKDGLILDLCCGIGRHSVLLTKKGYSVVGVDISPDFIKRAKEIADEEGVGDNCRFLLGDMRKLHEVLKGEQFNAVINMFSSLGYYDDPTEVEILKGVREVTKPCGLLVIDAPNRDWIIKNFSPINLDQEGEGQMRFVVRTLNLETSVLENNWTIFEKKGEDLKYLNSSMITHRILSLHEQIRFLKDAGWKYCEAYGDFELNPFTLNSNQMITVSKKVGFSQLGHA